MKIETEVAKTKEALEFLKQDRVANIKKMEVLDDKLSNLDHKFDSRLDEISNSLAILIDQGSRISSLEKNAQNTEKLLEDIRDTVHKDKIDLVNLENKFSRLENGISLTKTIMFAFASVIAFFASIGIFIWNNFHDKISHLIWK
jgi:chromosome segregation ATPase